jgi:hypothetical protein
VRFKKSRTLITWTIKTGKLKGKSAKLHTQAKASTSKCNCQFIVEYIFHIFVLIIYQIPTRDVQISVKNCFNVDTILL